MTTDNARPVVTVSLLETRLWMWALFFGFFAIFILGIVRTDMPVWTIPVSFVLALLGGVFVFCLGPIHVGQTAIWETALVGCHGMRWDEVIEVEYNPTAIVFYGKNKQLVILGPSMWSAKERATALPILNALLSEKHIECAYNARAEWRRTRNSWFKRPNA